MSLKITIFIVQLEHKISFKTALAGRINNSKNLMETKKIIELTPELKSLVKSVVMAKAWVEVVHPIVVGYQKAVLQEINAVDPDGVPIVNPDYAFQMDEEKAQIYFRRCDEEAAKNKLEHDPECCPLLEAESAERDAKRALAQYMIPRLPGCEKLTYDNFNHYAREADGSFKRDKLGRLMFNSDELIDLILKLVGLQMADELKDLSK